MTAVEAAFITLITHLGIHSSCHMPSVIWNTPYIVNACQTEALPMNTAQSCYNKYENLIILPDGWNEDSHHDTVLLYHEMGLAIEVDCLKGNHSDEAAWQAETYAP